MTGLYTRLIDDAEESPVVDDVGDENQLFGGFLINYHVLNVATHDGL